MNARALLIILFLAAVIGGGGYYLSRKEDGGEKSYAGYGEGELVYVAAPIGGQLQDLSVQRGDEATKGAPLFSLEREQERAARAEAEENLRESRSHMDMAQIDFDRAKGLREKRVIAPQDYDNAQQTLLASQHTVAARQQALDQADWRFTQKAQAAPATGLVYDTYYRPGEWVPAGTPVLALLPPEYMKVRFFVPEGDLGRFPIGTPVRIDMDGRKDSLSAKVTFVSPKAEYTLPIIYSRENRDKLVFLVEASVNPEVAAKLHPGAPVAVRLEHPSP